MPAVALFIYGIGAAAASVFGIVASWGVGLAIGSAAIALTVASVRRMGNLKDGAPIDQVNGQDVMVRSTMLPRNIVFGEVQVGGLLTYVNSTGTEKRQLYFEIVHTGHEIDSFVGWYIDDKYIPVADVDCDAKGSAESGDDGSVDANSGGHGLDPHSGTPVLYLRGWTGADAQPVDSMLDSAFTEITSNHRHRGCARSIVRCDLVSGGESKWNGRAPQSITVVLRGAKCYDPRLDSTFPGGIGAHRLATPSTWAWTDNPALIWARYRTMPKALGPGWATTRINYQAVFDAANVCDVAVAIPTAATEKRFRCDLVVDTSMEPQQVVDTILATMAGKERLINGLWNVYAGAWPSTDFTLTESDLIGEYQFVKEPRNEDRYNQIKPSFTDRARLWKKLPTVSLNNTTLRTNRDAGEVLPKELKLEGVTREYQAQRLGMFALNQADDTGILLFPTGYNGLNIRHGDTGNVTIAELNFVAKTFRCVGFTWVDFVGAALVLKEDASGNYTDPAEGAYSTRTAAGDIVFGTVTPYYLLSTIPISVQDIATRGWTFDGTFSSTDADTVAWTSGTLRSADGSSTWSISSGNTGNMGARTFIFLDVGASTTVLQTTTTAANAIGSGRVLIAVAVPTSTGTQAIFQVFGGAGGVLSGTDQLARETATEVYRIEEFGTDIGDPVEDYLSVVVDVDSIVFIECRCNSCSGTNEPYMVPFVGGTEGFRDHTTDASDNPVAWHPYTSNSFLVSAGTYNMGVRFDGDASGNVSPNDRFTTITVVKR